MRKNNCISCLLVAFLFAGCGTSGPVSSESVKTPLSESTSGSEPVKPELPEFQYVGMNQAARICVEEAESRFESTDSEADVMIPANVIARYDESDLSDITIAVTIYAFQYRLEGENLYCVKEDVFPCRIHVRIKDGEGCEVFKVDTIDQMTVLEMCDGDEEVAKKMEDRLLMEEVRKEYLAMYVTNYDLPIKTYQDSGCEPIEIPNSDN